MFCGAVLLVGVQRGGLDLLKRAPVDLGQRTYNADTVRSPSLPVDNAATGGRRGVRRDGADGVQNALDTQSGFLPHLFECHYHTSYVTSLVTLRQTERAFCCKKGLLYLCNLFGNIGYRVLEETDVSLC